MIDANKGYGFAMMLSMTPEFWVFILSFYFYVDVGGAFSQRKPLHKRFTCLLLAIKKWKQLQNLLKMINMPIHFVQGEYCKTVRKIAIKTKKGKRVSYFLRHFFFLWVNVLFFGFFCVILEVFLVGGYIYFPTRRTIYAVKNLKLLVRNLVKKELFLILLRN